MRFLSYTVPAGKAGRSVHSLLRTEFHMSEGLISALKFRPGGIRLQGRQAHTDELVREGDILSARIDDADGKNPAEPVGLPLTVYYEDEDLIVLDKPAGMLIYGAEGGPPAVANLLAARWGQDNPVHPVHRLDRGTSGLLVVARSRYISDRIRHALHTGRFLREYLAIAEGVMEPPDGLVDLPIGLEEPDGLRRCVRPDGQPAQTEYETVSRFPGGSLLRLRLRTGRTHQIRVHLSESGHPLFGDAFYGGSAERIGRPALHSEHLRLEHPVTGQTLDFRAPLPEDMRSVLRGAGPGEEESYRQTEEEKHETEKMEDHL